MTRTRSDPLLSNTREIMGAAKRLLDLFPDTPSSLREERAMNAREFHSWVKRTNPHAKTSLKEVKKLFAVMSAETIDAEFGHTSSTRKIRIRGTSGKILGPNFIHTQSAIGRKLASDFNVSMNFLYMFFRAFSFRQFFQGLHKDSHDTELLIPPGYRIRGLLAAVYSSRTLDHVFEPVIADMQREWTRAMVDDHPKRAKWIRIRGYCHLLTTVVSFSLSDLFHAFIKVLKLGI